MGPGLFGSLKAWLHKLEQWRPRQPLPVNETAELGAAILRRVIRVGGLGLAVAALPMLMLVWQNLLIQRQVNQQASDDLIVRRAQLLATIYEEECEDIAGLEGAFSDIEPESGETIDQVTDDTQKAPGEICHPKAPLRARQEAALAFATIEKARGVKPDLSKANLGEALLVMADFSRAHLHKANLSEAILFEANLSEANFHKANLSGADLRAANLSGAALFETNLRDANVSGANLLGTFLLTQEQIDSANGDEKTPLPEGLKRPAHWIATEPETPDASAEESDGKS